MACLAETWESRWKKSSWKEADGTAGEFKLTAGKFGTDEGIQTSADSKFYATYAEIPKAVDNTGKDLVLQVSHGTPLSDLADRSLGRACS